MVSLGPRSFFKASQARELGRPYQCLSTTYEDEYCIWNVSPTGAQFFSPPFSLAFSSSLKSGHALLVTDQDGVVTVLDTTRSLRDQMNRGFPSCLPIARFRAHRNSIFDGIFLRNDTRVATASGDGTVGIFDIASMYRISRVKVAKGSIKSIRSQPGNDFILATASRDGSIRFFDLRLPVAYTAGSSRTQPFQKPVLAIENAHTVQKGSLEDPSRKLKRIQANSWESVTSLAWVKQTEIFSGGAADGTVKVWDVRNMNQRSCLELAVPGIESGCRRAYGIASLHAVDRRLSVSCTNSMVYLYDANALGFGNTHILRGHTQTSFYIQSRLSPCGDFLMSGSSDSYSYIWDLSDKTAHGILDPILRLEGHRKGEASCVAWCESEKFKVATCSDDTTVKLWNVVDGKEAAEIDSDDRTFLNGARKVNQVSRRRIESNLCKKKRLLKDSDIRSFFKPGTSQ